MSKRKHIGILSGGGDCPGTNAVIASVVKVASSMDYHVTGFEYGLEGLLKPVACRDLTTDDVKGISYLGGTILKTSNRGRFTSKTGAGEAGGVEPAIIDEAVHTLRVLGIDALIIIGGDGTLLTAAQLAGAGINIVGIPKTIDNDLGSTETTFGFSSAVDVVVDALDKIHTTATSHERTFIVECMGRSTGWITLTAGLAGGANAILLPEFDFNVDDLVNFIQTRRRNHHRSTVIAIAEGSRVGGRSLFRDIHDGEVHYSGISELLMGAIEDRIEDEDHEVRHVILGHTQRGTMPNAYDRGLAKRYGVAAIEAVADGNFGQMVCLSNSQMGTCSLAEATAQVKRVSESHYEYHVAKRLGIYIH
jgi:ATP-dependent phosphofructokinase / diphosphate-dependent phosphofructokinase